MRRVIEKDVFEKSDGIFADLLITMGQERLGEEEEISTDLFWRTIELKWAETLSKHKSPVLTTLFSLSETAWHVKSTNVTAVWCLFSGKIDRQPWLSAINNDLYVKSSRTLFLEGIWLKTGA
jgi:hypothetical protein